MTDRSPWLHRAVAPRRLGGAGRGRDAPAFGTRAAHDDRDDTDDPPGGTALAMLAILAAACAATLALAGGFLGHIGYLGGPSFIDYPPAAHAPARDVSVVLLSGDLGLSVGLGRATARRLAANGYPVVGVNMLTAFRARRTPAEAEALLERAAAHAESFGNSRRLVLLGQSFGADLLHVALAQAPATLRTRVRFVGLIVPGDSVDYRATPSGLWSRGHDAAALDTARMLDWVPVTCIQGARETDSLCPLIAGLPNVARVVLPGGHPLRRDDGAVYRALIERLEPALAAPGAGA